MDTKSKSERNFAAILLAAAGCIYLGCALIYNRFLLPSFFAPDPELAALFIHKIRLSQLYFLSIGLIFIILAILITKSVVLKNIFKKTVVTNLLLFCLCLFIPASIFEVALRPYAKMSTKRTTIFMPDSDLGWKLRPQSEDLWMGAKVKINGKGLRGPELSYSKPADSFRILYLGDSVTFGFLIEGYERTYPYLAEGILENRQTRDVQTVNGAVGGYSPWQYFLYLSNEGVKYDPDLVVVSFVLNDVPDKFRLARFGGVGDGIHLSHSISPTHLWLIENSSLAYFAGKLAAGAILGRNIQRGATRRETYKVEMLVDSPDLPEIQKAWQVTLENLDKIFNFCRQKDIPVVLVIFPYSFQFADIKNLAGPQNILNQYAAQHQIPTLDLLPVLAEKMKTEGRASKDYFLDQCHLSPTGNRVVAEIIADFFLRQAGLFPDRSQK